MPLPVPGEKFGDYLVEAPVGQGGMGVVYRGRDPALGRLVAIKVLRVDRPGDDDVPRILREARLAARLAHRGIVTIYEVGAVGDVPFVAMEWAAGSTLRALLRRDPPDLATRSKIVVEIADALAHAHERGVVHRDLKPANVIVTPEGHAKLLDFGLAKNLLQSAAAETVTLATRADLVLGTPRYMAPEQRHGGSIDARADQYAWGVLAYETLAGRHPADAGERSLAEQAPEVSARLAAAIDRARSAEPNARFASMTELLATLTLAGAGVTSRPPRASTTPNRLRVFLGSAAAILVAGGAALAASLLLRRPPPPPEPTPVPVVTASAPAPPVEPSAQAEPSASAEAPPIAVASSAPKRPPHVDGLAFQESGLASFAPEDQAAAKKTLASTRARIHKCLEVPHSPGAEIHVQLGVAADGAVVSSEGERVCLDSRGFCGSPSTWYPKSAADCVAAAFLPLRFPPTRDPTGRRFILSIGLTR